MVVQRVEGVEEGLLRGVLAREELDVVDQQDVDVPVAALEAAALFVAIELMKSFVNSSLDTYRTRMPGKSPIE